MPRPNPPPTPGSSSDIRGKEADLLAPAFDLPPTAYPEQDRASSNSSVVSSANGSDSSYRPASSGVAAESRKRSAPHSGPVITTDDFTLPPPPTRSRKIIQMKPRGPAQHHPSAAQPSQGAAKTQTAGTQGGKRKQNATGQTAAGRKIARKTAHSLIERRRRSKMNEEFGVLKEMIPACQGQEMHKLAILQASIEYLRYLEQCISDLQAQTHSSPSLPPPSARNTRDMHNDDEMDDNDDEDEEMPDEISQGEEEESQPTTTAAPTRTNSLISLPSLSQLYPANPTSPPIFPQPGTTSSARHFSISSASQPSYSPYMHSHHASPAFGPQLPLYHPPPAPPPPQATANQGTSHFGLGSPALKPEDSSPLSIEGKNPILPSSTPGNSSSSNDRPTTRLQPQPSNLNPLPSPPTPAPAPVGPSSLEQDATSAAAVALSMLNSSASASRPATFSSSPFFPQRGRRRSLDPPRQEAKPEPREGNADAGTKVVVGGWRPLGPPQRTCFSDSSPVGRSEEFGRLLGADADAVAGWSGSRGPGRGRRGLDGDDAGVGGGGGWGRNGDGKGNEDGDGGSGIGGGGVGGGISVRDLLSS
ncbi:hypothetical protein D0864_12654 [Hortaea werneckii]|uniref:BHLH domain-containing protein n=1 Tax=Hortaea werneckii TaxID=91943 RepID=A0A3M7DGB1_HORWE|nr:hypothetical protein D0864_12654 [Hortaea werneckii]